MRVRTMLCRVLKSCREEIHATRFAGVVAVVAGIISGRRLSLTAIGRAIGGRSFPKHSIKRVDRLLSNWRMRAERWRYFSDLAAFLVGRCLKPVVLVDWTKVTDDFHALVAAVPIGGRALTVYEEVHPERKLGSPRVQAAFLRALRDVLPDGCRPIVVTDAGFQGPFFRAVRQLGWDFVGRIRGTAKMRSGAGSSWQTVSNLYATATANPRDLGDFQLYKESDSVAARLVLAPRRRRRKKHPWRWRWSAQGGASPSTISGAKEPWLLATSIPSESAARIIAIYATRMQIEETFRDVKNPRFGWSLRHVRGYSDHRLTLLVLFAALATLVVTLLGLAASAIGHHRRYQANTSKARVLSNFVLGLAILERRDFPALGDTLRHGQRHIHSLLHSLSPA
jgi:Transposase DDE domain